jgi:hypothetical protein
MDNSWKNNDDPLRKYLNPERIEKAPEGLTGKIMARIQVERSPVKITGKIRHSNLVLLVSAGITVILLSLAVIFPPTSEDTIFSGILKYLSSLNLTFSKIKMVSGQGFNLPSIIIYIAIGFFVLTLFDRALDRVFRRKS